MLFSTHKYAVDACSFIHFWREYPRDVFPGVWKKIGSLLEDRVICSVEEVFLEIKAKDDEVADWAKDNRHIFLPPDEDLQRKVSEVLRTHPNLLDVKKGKSGADPFLIAAAIIHGCAVVTEEKPSREPQKPTMPNVCKHYRIKCIRALDMFREEGMKL